jgi:hypothetical protein
MKIKWTKLGSRKFLALVGAVVLTISNALAGQPLDVNHLLAAVGALLTYIAVEGIIDHKAVKNGSGKATMSGALKKEIEALHGKIDGLALTEQEPLIGFNSSEDKPPVDEE